MKTSVLHPFQICLWLEPNAALYVWHTSHTHSLTQSLSYAESWETVGILMLGLWNSLSFFYSLFHLLTGFCFGSKFKETEVSLVILMPWLWILVCSIVWKLIRYLIHFFSLIVQHLFISFFVCIWNIFKFFLEFSLSSCLVMSPKFFLLPVLRGSPKCLSVLLQNLSFYVCIWNYLSVFPWSSHYLLLVCCH